MFSINIVTFGFAIILILVLTLSHAQPDPRQNIIKRNSKTKYRPSPRTTIATPVETTTEQIRTSAPDSITLAPTVTPPPITLSPRITGRSRVTAILLAPTRRLPPPLCWSRGRVCSTINPIICGRNRNGICRRFINACHMQNINCMLTQDNVWQNTPAYQCTNIPPNTAARCRSVCPRRPIKCIRQGPSLCVMDSAGKLCRRVANNCMLRNLNCHSSPRENWSVTKMCKCQNMCVGGEATACCNNE